VAFYIIVTEFCERLAFYGFAGSLVLFFQTKLHMDNATADVQVSGMVLSENVVISQN
jgi:dipeptide/tripeptide permease